MRTSNFRPVSHTGVWKSESSRCFGSASSALASLLLIQMLCCLLFLSLSCFRCLVLASFFQGQGMLPYFANFRLLAEFSTPCVNQRYVPAYRWSGLCCMLPFILLVSRDHLNVHFDSFVIDYMLCFSWFFEVLGYPKTSRPNMANGIAMAAVFFMVRIAVMPVYYSRMYAVYGTEAFYLVPWGGRVAWICSSICLDIMNVMWMHKIARGCYKVLRSARQSRAAKPQENGKTD